MSSPNNISSPSLPTFFILGAPKCGTTSLANYLRGHPNVFMSNPKEPNYFNTDLPRLRLYTDWDSYLQLFSNATPQHLAIGEASTWYLHSNEAIPNILTSCPDARMIAMLRNPVEMIPSLHSQFVYNGTEEETDFTKAWQLQNQRKNRPFMQYATLGKTGERLKFAFNHIPRTQLLCILFDDLRNDPKAIYLLALKFLGLPDDNRKTFEVANQNKISKNRSFDNFVRHTPAPLVRVLNSFKSRFGIQEIGLMKRLDAWNTKRIVRSPLPDWLISEMIDTFSSDIQLTEKLLGRDLTHWMKRPSVLAAR